MQDMAAMQPDARIINLETAMTTHDKPWPNKGINYRCHPGAWAWHVLVVSLCV